MSNQASEDLRERLTMDRLRNTVDGDFTHIVAVMTPDGVEPRRVIEFEEVVRLIKSEVTAVLDEVRAKLKNEYGFSEALLEVLDHSTAPIRERYRP